MNFNVIKNSLYSTSEASTRSQLLTLLLDDITLHKCIPAANLYDFFNFLSNIVIHDGNERHESLIVLEILIVIVEIGGYECEVGFNQISPSVILLFSTANALLRKKAKYLFKAFLKKTRNSNTIMETLIHNGLKSEHPSIKSQSLSLIAHVFQFNPSIFLSRISASKALLSLQEILARTSDKAIEVSTKAERILFGIRKAGYEGFYEAFNKLETREQEIYNSINDKFNRKLEIEIPISNIYEFLKDISELNSAEIDYSSLLTSFFENEVPAEKEDQLNYFQRDFNGFFGFLLPSILSECLYFEDPVVQLQGVTDLLKAFASLDEPFGRLRTSLHSFFKFLVFVMHSKSIRVVECVLSVLEKLINVPGVEQRVYLPLLLPSLFDKLGDERVFLRKRVGLLVKRLILQTSKPFILKFFLLKLNSGNWHIREETLLLIATLLLHLEIGIIKDLEKVSEAIARTLDDEVKKVREAGMEVIAILYTRHSAHDILHSLLFETVFDFATDKVEKADVFFLNEFGELEKPVHYDFTFELVKDPNDYQVNAFENEETRHELQQNKSNFHFARQDKEAREARHEAMEEILLKEGRTTEMEVPNGFGEYLTAQDFKLTDPSKAKGRIQFQPKSNQTKETLKFIEKPIFELEYKNDPRFKVALESQIYSSLFNIPFRIVKSLNAENSKVELLSKSIHHNSEAYKGYIYEDTLDEELKRVLTDEYMSKKKTIPIENEIQEGQNLNGHQQMEEFLDYGESIKSNKLKKERPPQQWDFNTEPPSQASLKQLQDPEIKARTLMLELKSSHFANRVKVCVNLRTLLLHHCEYLYEQPFTFAEIAKDLAAALGNAEPAFSRAILATLTEMAQLVKRNLDEAVEVIITSVLEKFREKGFYHDEIKRVLIAIGRNASASRILASTLEKFHEKGNEEFYSFICLLLEQIVITKGSAIKSYPDISLFFPPLLKILNFKVFWPRRAAKKLLYKLFLTGISSIELESIMSQTLTYSECKIILSLFNVFNTIHQSL